MDFHYFRTQDRPQNDPRQAQDGSKRLLKAYIFYVEFCVRFWSVFDSILDPFGDPFWAPKSFPNLFRNRSKIKLRQHSPMTPLQEGPRPPQEAPRPPQEAPRSPQEPSKTPQEAVRDPSSGPKNNPRGPGRSHLFPKSSFSNVLNKLDFLIKIFIGSFQEAIKKIQELPKINMSEPPSFQASMPLSLRVPAAKCLGGIREAQTITLLSENPTVHKLTRVVDERKRGTEEVRKSLRKGKGTEKSDECKRGMQKRNGKERAAGDETFELHLY